MKIIFPCITFLILACEPKHHKDFNTLELKELQPRLIIDSTIVKEEIEMKSFEDDLDSLKSQIEKL